MSSSYILGVDGGNSKTDFFLFDTEGTLHGHHRMGTCSHEALTGYPDARDALASGLATIQQKTGVSPQQIAFAAMGLAGVDIPSQYRQMQEVLQSLELRDFALSNDGVLGIKAATSGGCGICSINGTGTVTIGLDSSGSILQIGGIGDITQDAAGGGYIARRVITLAYCHIFRNGLPFGGTEQVAQLLQITAPDQWLDAIHPTRLRCRPMMTQLVQLVLRLAEQGDEAACALVQSVAHNLADGVLGCLQNQQYTGTVEVVQAGSVWVKGGSTLMQRLFLERIAQYSSQPVQPLLLEQPPAIGAVFWAFEGATGRLSDQAFRQRVTDAINKLSL